MRYSFTRVSSNSKVGPLPIVTASKDTCPNTCPLKNAGCYAEGGPMAIHWRQLDHQGMNIDELGSLIQKLPKHQMWRYGQAGDLPPLKEDLDKLVSANRGRPVIAYSHRRDVENLRGLNARGFHVNLSCDSLEEVDRIADGISAVAIIPSTYQRQRGESLADFRARLGGKLKIETPAGRPAAICPQTYLDGALSCASCGLCASSRVNDTIIAFPAHGNRKKMVDNRLSHASCPATAPKGLRSLPNSSSTSRSNSDLPLMSLRSTKQEKPLLPYRTG